MGDAAPEPGRVQREALLTIHQILRSLGTEPDFRRVLALIVEGAAALLRAERGLLVLKSSTGPRVCAARNLSERTVRHDSFQFSRSIVAECWHAGETVVSDDARTDRRFRGSGSVVSLGLASVACIPLKCRGELIGTLYLDHRFRKGLFGAAELSLLEIFADQAGIVLQNALSGVGGFSWADVDKVFSDDQDLTPLAGELNAPLPK